MPPGTSCTPFHTGIRFARHLTQGVASAKPTNLMTQQPTPIFQTQNKNQDKKN